MINAIPSTRRKHQFQLNSSQLFLTYPECPLEKEDVLRQLSAILDVQHYIVARERHANGHYHIHVYLKLNATLRTTEAKLLDLFDNDKCYHGNYQGCRSNKNVAQYVTKNEDYISDLDVGSIVDRESATARACKGLAAGTLSLEQAVEICPQLLLRYSQVKQSLIQYQADKEEVKDLPNYFGTPWGFDLEFNRDSKQRHYWIYSTEPNAGKTTFAKYLCELLPGSKIVTGDTTYWNVSKSTQLLMLDDYNAPKLSAMSLNQLCDGTFQFRIFQGGVVQLARKYTMIVFSNVPISTLYLPNFEKLLKARFIEKCLDPKSQESEWEVTLSIPH